MFIYLIAKFDYRLDHIVIIAIVLVFEQQITKYSIILAQKMNKKRQS
jgi:hypothetical protein